MKIFDIAQKDLLRSFRSMFMLGMCLVAPLAIAGLIYLAFSGMSSNGDQAAALADVRVSVVNLDRPRPGLPYLGESVLSFLQDERMPAWLVVSEMESEAAARSAIERQEISVAVIIPPDFSAALAGEGGRGTLTLLHDPTLTGGPAIVKGLLEQFAGGVSGSAIAYRTITAQMEANRLPLDSARLDALMQQYAGWYSDLEQDLNHGSRPVLNVQTPSGVEESAKVTANPIERMLGLIMAAQIIFFAFFTGAYGAESLLKEDEEGTLARLFSTPTARPAVLGGKFLAVFITIILQSLVLLLAFRLIFDARWGHPLTVGLVLVGQVAAAGGLGIFLISLMKSTKQAGPVLGGVLTGLGMLGGLFTSNISMPAAFQAVNLFTPQGWALKAWKLAINGAGPGEVLLPLAVLLTSGALLFALGARIFRGRFS